MKTHRILYFDLDDITFTDGYNCLIALGHYVSVLRYELKQYDYDDSLIAELTDRVKEELIDIIFSFNYYPDLSRVADSCGIRYVCWVVDSPHGTLNSVTLGNNCNTINIFDYGLYERYHDMGYSTVRYMPLACNVDRVQKQLAAHGLHADAIGRTYQHEISFLGSLYNNEYNFYDQIKYLPEYVRGYIDAAMEVQKGLYGVDIVSQLITDDIWAEVSRYVRFDIDVNYIECNRSNFVHMIQRKITVTERYNLLKVLGEHYRVDHYAPVAGDGLNVNYLGYASYVTQMPEIFASSKINLNITLRSILTGIPLRVIDILGAGGFCISNYQAELGEYFENNKSIVWYESYEDLFEKVGYYLTHEDERARIALAGHKIVKEQFSYDVLLPKVLE